jgi:hypothetical protein
MTAALATLDPPVADAATESDGFRRIAAIAGIASVTIGATAFPVLGSVPTLGDSATKVAEYFAGSGGLHRAAVVIAALLGIPIAIFFCGVYRSLGSSRGRSGSAWSTAFLFGAIMMSATAGLREALYAFAVRYAETQPDPAILRVLNDGSQIAGATLGAWTALAVGSVAVAALRSGTAARWYWWFSGIVATVAAVSVVDTVSTSTGGALATLVFPVTLAWILATGIVMLRRPLLP